MACLTQKRLNHLLPQPTVLPAVQQNQAGTLKSQTPKNCLASPTVKDQLAGVVEPKCFDSVKMNLTNTTGAACTAPSVLFNVSFADPTCFGGEMVGGGEMMAAKSEFWQSVTVAPVGSSYSLGTTPCCTATYHPL